jgi:hypothetical protein
MAVSANLLPTKEVFSSDKALFEDSLKKKDEQQWQFSTGLD